MNQTIAEAFEKEIAETEERLFDLKAGLTVVKRRIEDERNEYFFRKDTAAL